MVMTDAVPRGAFVGIEAPAVEAMVTQLALPHWIGTACAVPALKANSGGSSGPAGPSLLDWEKYIFFIVWGSHIIRDDHHDGVFIQQNWQQPSCTISEQTSVRCDSQMSILWYWDGWQLFCYLSQYLKFQTGMEQNLNWQPALTP